MSENIGPALMLVLVIVWLCSMAAVAIQRAGEKAREDASKERDKPRDPSPKTGD